MRKIFNILSITAIFLTSLLSSCSEDESRNYYSGESFIMFEDSAYMMPVTEVDEVFEVAVGMTKAMDHDRYVAVAVDPQKSNAIEGYHYTIESNNVLIPAGQLSGKVRVHGIYKNINSVDDSLAITLKILADKSDLSDMYGNTTNVRLRKIRPFNIDDYVGDMLLTCTFPFSTSSVTRFYVKTEKIDSHRLRIKKPFEDSRDIMITFHEDKSNPFDQSISVKEQIAFTDERFGPVSMSSVEGAPSYYLPENRAFVLYMEAYLSNVGSFGAYYYIFEWVSHDRIIANDNGLSTIY